MSSTSVGGMLPKLGFFVKALGRFVILALVLFMVANKINIQPLDYSDRKSVV